MTLGSRRRSRRAAANRVTGNWHRCLLVLAIGLMLLAGGTAGASQRSATARKFRAVLVQYNGQLVKTRAALSALPSDGPITELAKALAPLTKSAERWEKALSDIRWPKADRTAAQTLIIAIAGEVGVIGSVRSQTPRTLTAWSQELASSVNTAVAADNVLRHDLGLPAVPKSPPGRLFRFAPDVSGEPPV
jgi:hypothetical protein